MDDLIIILKKSKRRNHADIEVIVKLLSSIKFFKERELSSKDLQFVAQGLSYMCCNPNTNIIEFNSFGDKFYIILKGHATVLIPQKIENENGEIITVFNPVATLGPGKSFGELALINDARRFYIYK